MTNVTINYKDFGIKTSLSVGIFLGFLWPLLTGEWSLLPWGVAAALLFCSFFVQKALIPFHMAWGALAPLLSFIYTRIILTWIFYFIIMPIRLILKALRFDPHRKQWTERMSYRESRVKKPGSRMNNTI